MTSARPFRHRIAFRIMGIFLLIVIGANVLVVLAVRHLVKRDLEAGTKADLLNAIARLEADLDRLRDTTSLIAEFASRGLTVTDTSSLRTVDTAAMISTVELSRAQGVRIEEFTQDAVDNSAGNLFLRAFSGMPTSDYVIRGEAGSFHMISVAPVETGGPPRRVVTASYAFGRDFLRREKEALGGDVTVLDAGGAIASSSVCARCIDCIKNAMSAEGNWKAVGAGKVLYLPSGCDVEDKATAILPLRTFDGKTVAIALSRSREAARTTLFHMTVGLVLGSVLLAAGVSAAFYAFLSRVTNPLRVLTRMAGAISEGKYGETIEVRGKGEVAELAQAFNRMSLSQKQAMEEISAWNARLESRVEEKSQELAVIQRQMIEVEKLAAMGQFSAGVAHEINTPLSGILGFAELGREVVGKGAESGFTAGDASRLTSYFDQIESLSHRCRAIILDMLRFARKQTEEFGEVDLNAAVLQAVFLAEKRLRQGGVRVVPQLGDDVPALRGNVLQLQQAFTNIILNSVQAMPSGGTLRVVTRICAGTAEAEFEDTGTGIPEEHIHRIFDPFFTTRPAGEGSGLGLSVSYGIVKQHGGDIRVKSAVGQGTSITVVLPIPAADPSGS